MPPLPSFFLPQVTTPAVSGAGAIDRPTGLPESILIAHLQQGRHDTMAALFRAYFPPLVRFTRAYTASMDDAEELVAGIFARLWERRAHWAPRHTIESYLFAAARHSALNMQRSARRAAQRNTQFAHDLHDASHEEANDTERLARLLRATAHIIHALPEPSRVVLELRWHRQMSYAEIAEVVGGTPGSVQRRHSRIIEQLRGLLAVQEGTDV